MLFLFVEDVRLQHICYWPSHTDHFGEELDTFYVKFANITDLQRLVSIFIKITAIFFVAFGFNIILLLNNV